MLSPFAKLLVDDETLNRVQDRVKASLDELVRVPLLDGRLVEVRLTFGVLTPIEHGLDRPWTGYIVVARDQNAVIFNQAPAGDSDRFLYLQSFADINATLWVF